MIKINGIKVEIGHFPDGTYLVKENPEEWAANLGTRSFQFTWHFENNGELFALFALTRHFQKYGMHTRLFLPYVPNARQDRTKMEEDVYTLKYFCEIINELNFDKVSVLDPHSNVCAALLDRVVVIHPEDFVSKAVESVIGNIDETVDGCGFDLFYPDEGAGKRYSELLKKPYSFGIKKRDWSTGDITGLDVITHRSLANKTILIIDDICSKGGTFYHAAKEIKKLGAASIYLYVTHLEKSVFNGEFGVDKKNLLDCGLIEGIYTTNSIFTDKHDRITTYKI